jgi:hypothetical protein
MKTNDVIFNSNGTATVIITEQKKHMSQRTIVVRKEIATSKRHKSLKNWVDIWRPRIENQYSKDYLFIQPSGKPWTIRHLGHVLSTLGKQVFPYFHPYDMRHWGAIAWLIHTKHQNKSYDPYWVRNWLGHENIETTMKYLRFADQYYLACPVDWINRVLKKPRKTWFEENAVKSVNPPKTTVSGGTTGESQYGPGEPYTQFMEGFHPKNNKNLALKISNSPFSFFISLGFFEKTASQWAGGQNIIPPVKALFLYNSLISCPHPPFQDKLLTKTLERMEQIFHRISFHSLISSLNQHQHTRRLAS